MALVTGNYVTSAGVAIPAGAQPRVEIVPSGPATTVTGQTISQEPQAVTPNATTGAYSFTVLPTDQVLQRGFHYKVRGYYLAPAAYGDTGHTRHDLFELPLQVPTAGGNIGSLYFKQFGNDLVYAAPDAVNPSEQTGFQLDTETGDLYQWKA